MPARDLFHDAVKIGLEKEGWTITADPLRLEFEDKLRLLIDLAAEKMLAAQKGELKIAVEVKSFAGKSLIEDFHQALGQFLNYRLALESIEPERELYLAVPLDTYKSFFKLELPRKVIETYSIKLIVYNAQKEVLVEWIS